jgi:two-component system, NarL family, nitrate/nitrite sensor histidine kinase NarX
VLRLGTWIAAIACLSVVSILASITVAELSTGEARAINLAGSLRMQSYVIHAAVGQHGQGLHGSPNVEQAVADFDGRYRNPALVKVVPANADDPVRLAYEGVGEFWQARFRPSALRAINDPAATPSLQGDTAEIVRRIDGLVVLVEQGLEAKLQLLRLVQGVSLVLLLIVGAIAVFQLKTHVLHPLDALLTSARRVRRGDFSVRVPPREPDELGQLGEAFNFMVEDLSRIYAQLENRVQEKTEALARSNQSLKLLYRTARALSERAVTRSILLQLLQEVEQVIGIRSGALCLHKAGEIDIAAISGALDPAQVEALCRAGCRGCTEDGGQIENISTTEQGGSRRTISVPLFDGTRNHGAMLLVQAGDEPLEPWQIELLETVGRHIGGALAATQRNEERNRLALLDERSVIARELHDSLAQSLSYLKIQVTRLQSMLSRNPPPEPVNDVVRELRDGLNEAYRQLRELLTTFRLRIDGRGLSAAIDDTVQEFRRRTDIAIVLGNRLGGIALTPGQEIHVLQIIREALSNIERHAHARHVSVTLENDRTDLLVTVEDDGIGIDQNAVPLHRYGIVIMRDRAQSLDGDLSMLPGANGGTRVELRVPATVALHDPQPPAQGSTP